MASMGDGIQMLPTVRAPIWLPPPLPRIAVDRERSPGGDGNASRTPSPQTAAWVAPMLPSMLIEVLLCIWAVTGAAGLIYCAIRGERRDFVLHVGWAVGRWLTYALVLCMGLWMVGGGWGPPFPLFFGFTGLCAGVMSGVSTY